MREERLTSKQNFAIEALRPPRWLTGAHAQTIYANLVQPAPTMDYRRERLRTEDGDFFDVDWIDGDDDAPTLLIMHGFEGNMRSPYVRRLTHAARELGYRSAVLNFRGCSGEPNAQLASYHSGFTCDLAQLTRELAARPGNGAIFLIGYSLGGNMMACWLGDEPENVPDRVRGAVLVSTPFDLTICARAIDASFNRFYRSNFLRSLRQKIRTKAGIHRGAFDATAALRARTLLEFDDIFTARLFGFESAKDYYRRASSRLRLSSIRVPTLALAALDDPMVPAAALPAPAELESSAIELVTTRHGGHLGFISRDSRHWLEQQILGYCAAQPQESPMKRDLFVYGSLLFPRVMEHVTGQRLPGEPAILSGHRRFRVRDQPYPGVVTAPDGEVHGQLMRAVPAEILATLDAFEGELYERATVTVADRAGKEVRCEVYRIPDRHRHRLTNEAWDEALFAARDLEAFIR